MVLYIIILKPTTRKLYRHMYNFAGDCIYANSDISRENECVCNEMAIQLIRSSIKIKMLILFSIFLTCCAPLYKIFFTDENDMIIPVLLPFVNIETQNGFYINLANQLVTCGYGVIIIPGTELITCVLKNAVSVTAAVIRNSTLEFSNEMQKNNTFSTQHTYNFRNIILKILDFDRFQLTRIIRNYF